MLQRPREFAQYVAIRYTERLAEASVAPSVGSRGDSYDNALAASFNGLYKAELIHRRAWTGLNDVEYETIAFVDWFNHRRLHGEVGMVPPAEFEASTTISQSQPPRPGLNTRVSLKSGAVQLHSVTLFGSVAGHELSSNVIRKKANSRRVMRILTLYDSLPPATDGGADFAMRLAGELRALGHAHAFLVPSGLLAPRAAANIGPVLTSSHSWSHCDRRARVEAQQLIARWGPDVLHVVFPGKRPGSYALPLDLLTEGPWPGVITNFAIGKRAIQAVDLRSLWAALRAAKRIVCMSSDQASIMDHVVGLRRKNVVIPSGGALPTSQSCSEEPSKARARLGLPEEPVYFGYFGYIYRGKGVPDLVDACGVLNREGLDVRLLLIGGKGLSAGFGDGPNLNPKDIDEVKEAIERNGLTEKVVVTGFLNPIRAESFLRACDAVVFPAKRFASGRSTAVAVLGNGVPLILPAPWPFKVTPYAEPWGNVVFYEPKPSRDMVTQLRLIATDRPLRSSLRAGASALASFWKWPDLAERYARVFKQSLT